MASQASDKSFVHLKLPEYVPWSQQVTFMKDVHGEDVEETVQVPRTHDFVCSPKEINDAFLVQRHTEVGKILWDDHCSHLMRLQTCGDARSYLK